MRILFGEQRISEDLITFFRRSECSTEPIRLRMLILPPPGMASRALWSRFSSTSLSAEAGTRTAGLGRKSRVISYVTPPYLTAIAFVNLFSPNAGLVNRFVRDVLQQLPMEFAVEAQKLLGVSLEGSVG